jgi:hypothetical protein
MLSLRLKGKWSIRQRQVFHYDSISIIYPLHELSFIFFSKGEKFVKASSSLCFWRLMPKGERLLGQSKRTALPSYFLKPFFKRGRN